ncbi:MAG: hypothetical protein PHH09_01505 [Methanoregulaceae archaeon]|nr:hypothetical protein [Methanoregulaceae archaeon]MDD5047587.1 hypothetical protein [Methanoregulaceae archaeon]
MEVIGWNVGYAYKIWLCPRCGMTLTGYTSVLLKKRTITARVV